MPRSNASSARHPRTAPDSDKVRQPVPTEMRYLDLRASWLGGSGHILDAQCNTRLPSASMAARRAAWLTASAVPGWWALTAAAGEGWVLEAQLWLAHGQLEVLTAPSASVAAAGGRDTPNEHQIDRIVCEGGQAPTRPGLRN